MGSRQPRAGITHITSHKIISFNANACMRAWVKDFCFCARYLVSCVSFSSHARPARVELEQMQNSGFKQLWLEKPIVASKYTIYSSNLAFCGTRHYNMKMPLFS